MNNSTSNKTYRIRVGDFVYEGLGVNEIIKNIRSGKLKREHEIARVGSDSWTRLGRVPELARFFEDAMTIGLKPDDETTPEEAPVMVRYDIRKGNNVRSAVLRNQLAEMIRRGELSETDMIRACPDGDWMMAGDEEEFRGHFDMRRRRIAEQGYRADRAVPKGAPFYADLAAPFVYIGNLRFLFNLIAILIFFAIAIFVPVPIVSGPILFLTNFYLWSYYFRVVANTSAGGRSFPEFSDTSDLVGDLFRPAVQFFLTWVAALMPLFIYIVIYRLGEYEFFVKIPYVAIIFNTPWAILFVPVPTGREVISILPPEMGAEGAGFVTPMGYEFLYSDLVVWALLLFWLFYIPISLMRQASYGEFWPAFNLIAVFISIARAFGPYLALIFYTLAIDFIGILVLIGVTIWYGLSMIGPGGEAMMLFPAPFALLIQALFIVGTFLKMFFVGRFLHQYSDRMGWD